MLYWLDVISGLIVLTSFVSFTTLFIFGFNAINWLDDNRIKIESLKDVKTIIRKSVSARYTLISLIVFLASLILAVIVPTSKMVIKYQKYELLKKATDGNTTITLQIKK